MKFGLSDGDFKIFQEMVIDPLKEVGAKVYVFGSRVTGKHHPFSDIDVLYTPPSSDLPTLSQISTIKESIEESRFPVKLDLVCIEDLAESYRTNVLATRIEV